MYDKMVLAMDIKQEKQKTIHSSRQEIDMA